MRFALLSFLLVSCALPDVDLTGKACPCGDGYQCDPATDSCVVDGEAADVETQDAGPDDGGTDLGTDGGVDAGPEDLGVDGGTDAGPEDLGTDMPPVTRTAIPYGALWEYHDQDEAPPAGWETVAGEWPLGEGQLGYGDGDETTLLLDAEPNVPTAYFRRTFETSGDALGAVANVLYDDGFVLYVNGTEVGRENVDDTAHAAFTIAQGVGDNVVVDVPVPAALIVDGLNYVAVMVKQDDGVSSDLSFDLELRVTAP
ncbi:MAG: hypothetical protein CMN30_04215 [Sandaracinus sp.]|nr:hypothetical protein [Sandaracinus sp.]